MEKWSEQELNEMIKKVGFHNKKASYIKESTRVIMEEHGGLVP